MGTNTVQSTHLARYQPARLPFRLRLNQLILHIILLAVALSAILPFVWLIFASFKNFRELVSSKELLPQVWTLANYEGILYRVNFATAFRNSVVSATVVTVATLFTSSALGYVFAKYHFWGKERLFMILLATMMVPFAVILVPLYIIIGQMGLINHLGGIIITGLWSTFGIFFMRQFMETIPYELIDAARIDGASEWRIFFRIVLPMSTSPLAALAVFVFLGNWDSFLWPLVVLNSPDKQTLPLILAGLRNLFWTRYEIWAAGAMLTVIPVMIIYSLASRFFIQGIAMTGLKA